MAAKNDISTRKAFNFFRSYMEIAKELPDKDRLAFYDALIHVQFTGEELELTGLAKFAYISQKHNIDAQINGFANVGLSLKKGFSVAPSIAPSIAPKGQVQVQVQEQEKVQEQEQEKKERKKTKVFTPPTLEEVKEYFRENGFLVKAGEKAYNYYNIAGWKDSKGNAVKNWKQKMISVWFKDENRVKDNSDNVKFDFDFSKYDIDSFGYNVMNDEQRKNACLGGTFKLKQC